MSRKHVPLLAAFSFIQGGCEVLGGLLFALSPGGTGAGGSPELWIGLCLVGLGVAAVGLFRMVAAALNLSYRGRGLGMTALVLGLLSCVTCFCLPTSVALCVYGFVVYTNADVRRAFAMRAPAETESLPAEPRTEWELRAAALVERLEHEPVAWLQAHESDEPLEKLEDAWLQGKSQWALFSEGRFFEISIVRGRVVQRSAPSDDRGARLQIQSSLQSAGQDAAFSLVAIPESVRGEILRKTDTKSFPSLLESCRITVVGQMTTGMPVAWNSFGPVDRGQEPERWASESRALMALLSERLTTGVPPLTAEHFRSIRFEDRG